MRKATELELNTPIEIIKYSKIDTFCKNIEKKNIKKYGKSISKGSMRLPQGIVSLVQHGNGIVEIHDSWKDVLKNMYLLA